MEEQQIINAIKRIAEATTKFYDGEPNPITMHEVNKGRGDIESAICRIAEALDEDDVFTC